MVVLALFSVFKRPCISRNHFVIPQSDPEIFLPTPVCREPSASGQQQITSCSVPSEVSLWDGLFSFQGSCEGFCVVLSSLESEKGHFARCVQKKFLSRPIQIVFCDWTAHFLIMYNMLATAQCPEVLFLYLVNCCVINSGKILAGHAKVFCRLCKRKTME